MQYLGGVDNQLGITDGFCVFHRKIKNQRTIQNK